MNRNQVVADILEERVRQEKIWSEDNDNLQDIRNFTIYIEDYAGWARTKLGMGNKTEARERFVQIAALAMAAVEQLDKRG